MNKKFFLTEIAPHEPKIQLYIQNLEEEDKNSLRKVSVQLERIYYSLLSWELKTSNFQTLLNKVTCIRDAVVHPGPKGKYIPS